MEELILGIIIAILDKIIAWALAKGNRVEAHRVEGWLSIGCLLLFASPFILFCILLMLSD